MTVKTRQWFIDRIGKTIFTNKVECKCNVCEFIHKNGLVIDNEFIATALYDCYKDFRAEGDDFDYFDTKEERDKFEKEISNEKN